MVVVCAAVIVERGRALLSQRGKGKLAGLWEFPGGKLKEGEDPRACVARELMEENGIKVQAGDPYEVVRDAAQPDLLLLFFRCCRLAGEPRALDCAKVEFVPIGILDQRALAPNDLIVARRLMREAEV